LETGDVCCVGNGAYGGDEVDGADPAEVGYADEWSWK
jgi:hypothetical protein